MKDILIVEDDSSIRRLLQYDFGKMSFNVLTANDGQEAFDICQKESFDVIIVDWMINKRMQNITNISAHDLAHWLAQ